MKPTGIILLLTVCGAALTGRPDSLLVQWSEPGGSTGIVTNGSAGFQDLRSTYADGVEANPQIGTNYYSNAPANRSPVFNHAATTTANTKNVADGGAGADYIATAKNTAEYRSLVIWETLLTDGRPLQSLTVETRTSTTAQTKSVFRWVIQQGTDWFASDEITTTGAFSSYCETNAPGLLWHTFDPYQDIDSVTFADTASSPSLTDLDAIGIYSETIHDGSYIAHQIRFFQATDYISTPIHSYDTGYTIQKVRTAQVDTDTLIIASSYEGAVLGLNYTNGSVLWTNNLSGTMNHDLWCADITGDDHDEILVASADGSVYCLDSDGVQQWQFKPNDGGHLPPMYAVCVIHDTNNIPYVVCGGFDKSMYYLTATGALEKEIESSTYSQERPWGDEKTAGYGHTANFIRPILQPDGTNEVLAILGTMNHMQSKGSIYQFEPLADLPFLTNKVQCTDMIGDFRVVDPDGDSTNEVLLGASSLGDQGASQFDPVTGTYQVYPLTGIGDSGYRVTQVETIPNGDSFLYFMISGTHITLRSSLDTNVVASVEKIACDYAFNDLWKEPASGNLLLASSQSGGSCVHVIDVGNPDWKSAFMNLDPPGKIETIRSNTADVWTELDSFTAPDWERDPLPVYLNAASETHPVATRIITNYDSPVFLNSFNMDKEDLAWRTDPSTYLSNTYYQANTDSRMTYDLTQQEVWDIAIPEYNGHPGISYWAGHGNDPFMYQPATHKGLLAAANGKKTVMIWPEMNGSSTNFPFVTETLLYPVAEYAATRNGNIHIRNKNIFWQGAVYLPAWERLVSGEFSSVFITSMEETSDKTQDLSVAGRMGLWASGALDNWGMRCSRDNPSFDRSRQHSYQRLPNHFLRTTIYNLACGATHTQNTYGSGDYENYMSLIWPLIAKGAIYIPKRSEIVSFSPVHVSMTDPDEHYLEDGENNKWTIFYDREFEENNPYVFSRMNGSWMAAPVTEWDFSRYASGVKDRRQNFIPPYPNGTVLITPPQAGIFADPHAARSAMTRYLHPLYENIMQEFITNGRDYLSADGTATYAADTYYTTVESAIATGAQQLPLTVSGDVAWVAAQTAGNHLRLTLIDSGYLNPKARTATVTFHTVTPSKITDLLDGKTFSPSTTVQIDVPLGLFRFLDIELTAPFYSLPETGWEEFKKDFGIAADDADSDGDGELDLSEYALGGHPRSPLITGNRPSLEWVSGNPVFTHPQLTATDSGISYAADWTENLVTGPWSRTWSATENSTTGDPDFEEIRHRLDGARTNLFFRLNITLP